jgi:hypothetical protein
MRSAVFLSSIEPLMTRAKQRAGARRVRLAPPRMRRLPLRRVMAAPPIRRSAQRVLRPRVRPGRIRRRIGFAGMPLQ